MRCPHCGRETEGEYCPTCGYRVKSDNKSSLEEIKNSIKRMVRVASIPALILFIAFLVLNTAILIWSLEWIPNTMITEGEGVIYIVLMIPIGIARISGTSMVIFFFFLSILVLLSYILIFYLGLEDFFAHIKETLISQGKKHDKADSPIPRLAYIFMALLFFSYLYYILLEGVGVTPETPPIDELALWEFIYLMTQAAVWEELMVRTVFLGLPMFYYLYTRKKNASWKDIFGGFGLEDRFVLIPILLSSFIFGIAHIGGGWDITKFLPTFIAGLAFGYLYAKDGLHSAILLHFIWDYLSIPMRVFDVPNIEIYISLLILFWMAIGAYYAYDYLKRGLIWLKNKKEEKSKEQEETDKVPGTIVPGLSAVYVCSQCSNNKAIYTEDGNLECKRCGNKSPAKVDTTNRKIEKRNENRPWPPID